MRSLAKLCWNFEFIPVLQGKPCEIHHRGAERAEKKHLIENSVSSAPAVSVYATSVVNIKI